MLAERRKDYALKSSNFKENIQKRTQAFLKVHSNLSAYNVRKQMDQKTRSNGLDTEQETFTLTFTLLRQQSVTW